MRHDDEHEQFGEWLRSVMPPAGDPGATRDVWPQVANRLDARPRWTWVDVSLAAGIVSVLLMFPRTVFFLAYHL